MTDLRGHVALITGGVFLADPALTFHTGDTLTVDGGYTRF